MAFTAFLLLFPCRAKAATFNENQSVAADKVWQVKFSQEIELDSASQNGIFVIDKSGTKQNVTVALGQSANIIVVNPPKDGYKPGESYTLCISTDVHNKYKKNLKTPVNMSFLINNDADYNRDMQVSDKLVGFLMSAICVSAKNQMCYLRVCLFTFVATVILMYSSFGQIIIMNINLLMYLC